MFDVLAPGKLVLTLRSTPPFVAESGFALALTILLAAPLIVRVYLLLDKPLRALTKTVSSSRRPDCASRSLLIHYPAPVESADSTSSSSLHPVSARRINSTSALQSGGGVSRNSSRRGIRVDRKIGDRGSKIQRRCPPPNRPTSLADSRYPIIDISSLDYKAYRHRLIDATLKKQYEDCQPPGNVVLNSLHLNSADSVIGVRLNDRYDHSIFDFVEEYYDVAGATSRKNLERYHPLDHFLSRGAGRPRTSEKETETISNNGVDRENGRNHLPESVDSNPPKLPDMDDNGNPCVRADDVFAIATSVRDPGRSEVPILRRSIRTRSRADKTVPEHDAQDDPSRSAERSSASARKESRNDRPASAGNASKALPLSRAAILPENQEATGSPRPEMSVDHSRESKKKLEAYPFAVLSGKRRAEREAGGRSNFISVSSSEIASDSSKRRDDEVSCRSRESSISPRSRASSRRPPWLSGYRGTSFNRKYGRNITEISVPRVARPATRSAHGSGLPWQKLAVSSRGRLKESSTASMNRNPLPGRRATSFVASPRGRELVGITQRGENHATRQRSKSQDVESITAGYNEEGRTSKTADSPCGEKMPGGGTTAPDNTALSSSARMLVRPRKRSPRTAFSADAPVTASKTWAAKKPELISRRCGVDGASGRPISGSDASRASPVRDPRQKPAKLNRGGRRQLKSAENPPKGALLSPQIELSAEVLNPADDTDKSAILPDGEKLAKLTCRIDPRKSAGAAVSDGIRAEGAKGNDVKSNSAYDVAPKIMRNPRARPASANSLAKGRGPGAASHPVPRDANSEAKSGLNGTKLNARSNGAADEMGYESPFAKASSRAPRECGNAMAKETRQVDEGLRLPRRDSKIGLAMNSALKRYIKMLKQGDKSGAALASLSLSDAVSILSEQRTPLSPEEIRELQTVLDRIERNPELLCKLSCPSMESVV